MKKNFLSLLFFFLPQIISASDNTIADVAQKQKNDSTLYDILSCVDNRIATFFAQRDPYFQDFNAVKNYVKKTKKRVIIKNGKKILRYCCPHEGCLTYRDKNVTEVAACLLTHYSKDFFNCPWCTSTLKKMECLKIHMQKNCRYTAQPMARQSLPTVIIKLKHPSHKSPTLPLPRLVIKKSDSAELNICSKKPDDLWNEQIIVSSLNEFHSLPKQI